MINQSLLFALPLTMFGVILLLVYINGRKKEQFIKNYLQKKKNLISLKKSLLELLDTIVPSSIVMNEGEIQEKLINAGYYTFRYPHLYMPIKYIIVILGLIIISIANYNTMELMMLVSVLAIWVVISLIVPDAILDSRIKYYRSRVSRQLPFVIDLLAVCVQTGMTIEASLSYLAKEIRHFEPKISLLLERMNDRANVVGLEKALDEVYDHVPTTEMRSFVMTLKQSLQYGSSIYSTLTTLSADIRQVTMLTVEERIGKLAAKMSVPLILFIMMPIVILIAAPGVMRMMGSL
ncbi:type II secretion system F family protein [Vibrio panuliri]|uniref:type II secretion system F family protein n=1 Tax=Vibrio panuliri TaxID=1381081 RepID=UPI0013873DA0|nr:type II secretion system F family protein [Vibrio panuliri]